MLWSVVLVQVTNVLCLLPGNDELLGEATVDLSGLDLRADNAVPVRAVLHPQGVVNLTLTFDDRVADAPVFFTAAAAAADALGAGGPPGLLHLPTANNRDHDPNYQDPEAEAEARRLLWAKQAELAILEAAVANLDRSTSVCAWGLGGFPFFSSVCSRC